MLNGTRSYRPASRRLLMMMIMIASSNAVLPVNENRQSVDWGFQRELRCSLEDDSQLQAASVWKQWSSQQHTARVRLYCTCSHVSVLCAIW